MKKDGDDSDEAEVIEEELEFELPLVSSLKKAVSARMGGNIKSRMSIIKKKNNPA